MFAIEWPLWYGLWVRVRDPLWLNRIIRNLNVSARGTFPRKMTENCFLFHKCVIFIVKSSSVFFKSFVREWHYWSILLLNASSRNHQIHFFQCGYDERWKKKFFMKLIFFFEKRVYFYVDFVVRPVFFLGFVKFILRPIAVVSLV